MAVAGPTRSGSAIGVPVPRSTTRVALSDWTVRDGCIGVAKRPPVRRLAATRVRGPRTLATRVAPAGKGALIVAGSPRPRTLYIPGVLLQATERGLYCEA